MTPGHFHWVLFPQNEGIHAHRKVLSFFTERGTTLHMLDIGLSSRLDVKALNAIQRLIVRSGRGTVIFKTRSLLKSLFVSNLEMEQVCPLTMGW